MAAAESSEAFDSTVQYPVLYDAVTDLRPAHMLVGLGFGPSLPMSAAEAAASLTSALGGYPPLSSPQVHVGGFQAETTDLSAFPRNFSLSDLAAGLSEMGGADEHAVTLASFLPHEANHPHELPRNFSLSELAPLDVDVSK